MEIVCSKRSWDWQVEPDMYCKCSMGEAGTVNDSWKGSCVYVCKGRYRTNDKCKGLFLLELKRHK